MPLAGLTFVLTGALARLTRDQAKSMIRERGGELSESVGRKTNFLVAGKDPGSKLGRARMLGVPILDETEFLKRIQ